MNKEKYFIDLSKCSDEQHREVISLVKNNMEKTAVILDILLFNESQNLWCTFDKYGGAKKELTYPEFIKFFEGGEEENTEISFETEYRLEEFRKIQSEYFDENGECYSDIRLSKNIMEQMLTLINQLVTELNSNQ